MWETLTLWWCVPPTTESQHEKPLTTHGVWLAPNQHARTAVLACFFLSPICAFYEPDVILAPASHKKRRLLFYEITHC